MSTNRRKIYPPEKIFFPKNLDLEKVVRENPPPPHHKKKDFKFDQEDMKYIISNIMMLKSIYKDYHEDEFVPVNAQTIQRRVREYNYYIEYLLSIGIVEVKNKGPKNKGQYIPAEHQSRSFKLHKELLKYEWDLIEVTKKSLVSKRKKDLEADEKLHEKYGYLTKWFNDKLQINYARSYAKLNHLMLSDSGGDIHKKEIGKASYWEKYLLRLNNLKLLHRGAFRYSVDDNVKRFHSNLTSLKSELRNYITYDGHQLCAIDVKNSQPFISQVLFNPDFYENTKQILNLKQLHYNIYNTTLISIPTILSTINSSTNIMLVNPAQLEDKETTDIQRYCYLSDKGLLYKFFSEKYFEKTGKKLNVEVPDEKRQLKDAMFATLFSDNRFIGQPEAEMKRFFAEMFPNVYKVFSLIKRAGHNDHLPVILQLIESEVIVRRAASRIARNYPELPIYTVHDSIVTIDTEDYKEMVKTVLKEEFEGAIGLRPNLAFESWRVK